MEILYVLGAMVLVALAFFMGRQTGEGLLWFKIAGVASGVPIQARMVHQLLGRVAADFPRGFVLESDPIPLQMSHVTEHNLARALDEQATVEYSRDDRRLRLGVPDCGPGRLVGYKGAVELHPFTLTFTIKPLGGSESVSTAQENEIVSDGVNVSWREHAYPLRSITIQAQGTRHSTRTAIIQQLQTALGRLQAGEKAGHEFDDDFGYKFSEDSESQSSVFGDIPSGRS